MGRKRGGVRRQKVVFFFFQAEDGIRDLVRSRGLGDVYKRQGDERPDDVDAEDRAGPRARQRRAAAGVEGGEAEAVSYTHLTLPTSALV